MVLRGACRFGSVLAGGRVRRVLLLAGLVFAALPASAALGDTTVGQTATPHFYFGPGMEIAQTSAAMPAAGVVTEFQTQSGDCNLTKDGIYDFQVLRPLGNDQYRVVGDTGNQTDPCDSKLHTYPVRIPVQAGDVIGAYVVVNWQGFLGTDFPGIKSASAKIPKPVEGDTVTLKKDPADLGIDESARLFKAGVGGPPPPTSKAQCKHGGWKNFPQFKNQGQCLRFVNSHHKKHHHKHHPSSLAARVWES